MIVVPDDEPNSQSPPRGLSDKATVRDGAEAWRLHKRLSIGLGFACLALTTLPLLGLAQVAVRCGDEFLFAFVTCFAPIPLRAIGVFAECVGVAALEITITSLVLRMIQPLRGRHVFAVHGLALMLLLGIGVVWLAAMR